VLDVPTDKSDEEISRKSSNDDDVDKRSDDQEDDDYPDDDDQDKGNDDDQDTNNDGDDFVHPKLSIHEEEVKDEESFDPISLSVSSQFVTSMLNPSPDAGIDSLFETTPWVDVQASTTVASLTLTAPTLPPLTIPTTSQFARAVFSILEIVERYMDQRMNEAVKIRPGVQEKKRRKRVRVNKPPKGKETKTTSKSTEGSKSHQKTTSESAPTEEPMQTTQYLEEPSNQEFETGVADDQPIAEASQHPEWFQIQKKPSTPDYA
nr:hypothetical protein [Tanacetum cinerariifolium]